MRVHLTIARVTGSNIIKMGSPGMPFHGLRIVELDANLLSGLGTNQFSFLFAFLSSICLKGNEIAPHILEDVFHFHSPQQLTCLSLGPLSGFLS